MMHGKAAARRSGNDKRFSVFVAVGLFPVRPDNDLVLCRNIVDVNGFDLAARECGILRTIGNIPLITEAFAVRGSCFRKVDVIFAVMLFKRVAVVGIADLVAARFIDKIAALLVIIGTEAGRQLTGFERFHRGILRPLIGLNRKLIIIDLAGLQIRIGTGFSGTCIDRDKAVLCILGAIQHIGFR